MNKSQIVFIDTENSGLVQLELPPESSEVLPGIRWGNVSGFPSIAYWLYQVHLRRLTNKKLQYKLGATLLEEVGACLLGGHGIPAHHGLSAFKHMKNKGAFSGKSHSVEQLHSWLSQPIKERDKTFKYRFSKQKSIYLASALDKFQEELPVMHTGRAMRDWLLDIKGVGMKTASWIVRNWMGADDVAILDIHIYRAGILGGFFDQCKSVEKDYHELEEVFIRLADAMKVRTAELDALMWYEMQSTSMGQKMLSQRRLGRVQKPILASNNSSTNANQRSFF